MGSVTLPTSNKEREALSTCTLTAFQDGVMTSTSKASGTMWLDHTTLCWWCKSSDIKWDEISSPWLLMLCQDHAEERWLFVCTGSGSEDMEWPNWLAVYLILFFSFDTELVASNLHQDNGTELQGYYKHPCATYI